jgi:hypothetical protein
MRQRIGTKTYADGRSFLNKYIDITIRLLFFCLSLHICVSLIETDISTFTCD